LPEGGTVITDYQIHLSVDSATGGATAYMIKAKGEGANWEWVHDTEFGPFDTSSDVGRWVGTRLALDKAFQLR
jgi:hypothetical protein